MKQFIQIVIFPFYLIGLTIYISLILLIILIQLGWYKLTNNKEKYRQIRYQLKCL